MCVFTCFYYIILCLFKCFTSTPDSATCKNHQKSQDGILAYIASGTERLVPLQAQFPERVHSSIYEDA